MKKAMTVLAADAGTSDATVGFHAQQAVEKYLKALLCNLQVSYQRTHDLIVLLDARTDAGQAVPAGVDNTEYLHRIALQLRYDDISVGGRSPLDRLIVQQDVAGIRAWVSGLLTGPAPRR